eukprot:642680-Prymnesium_polylepis.1
MAQKAFDFYGTEFPDGTLASTAEDVSKPSLISRRYIYREMRSAEDISNLDSRRASRCCVGGVGDRPVEMRRPTGVAVGELELSDRSNAGYKYVSRHDDQDEETFILRCTIHGIQRHLGTFKTARAAAEAYA